MVASTLALKVYNHIRHTIDRVAERGWRRAFGWLGVAIAYFTYVYAPAHDIAVNADAVNFFLSLVFGAFVTRSAERVLGAPRAPSGGLVNNAALS